MSASTPESAGLRGRMAAWLRALADRLDLSEMPPPPQLADSDTADRRSQPTLAGQSPEPAVDRVRGPQVTFELTRPREDRYVELSEIGRGGMGRVIEVVDKTLRRRVALKLLSAEKLPTTARTAFVHEAQVTAQLEHPGVIPVHELGSRDNDAVPTVFYTMKRIRGTPLTELLALHHEDRTQLEPREVELERRRLIRTLQVVCLTVDYAHSRGVIHRDLKPDNVMVGDFGEVYVIDWGLARIIDPGDATVRTVLTEQGTDTLFKGTAGSPNYMAPELADGAKANARTDVYALGVILYELLCGKLPHYGRSPMRVLMNASSRDPKPPSEIRPDVPALLEEVCLRAIDRDAEERVQTVRELHDELQRYLDGAEARERRTAEAQAFTRTGYDRAAAYLGREQERARLRDEAEELRRAIAASAPVEHKRDLWALEDRERTLAAEAQTAFADAEEAFTKALEVDPQAVDGRRGLADLYLDRLLRAEPDADATHLRYLRSRAEALDDGRHANAIRGEGTLRVHAEPAGVEVYLYRFEEHERRLLPVPWLSEDPVVPRGATAAGRHLDPRPQDLQAYLGRAPVFRMGVPMGSYLAVIRSATGQQTRVSVRVGRSEDVDVLVAPMPTTVEASELLGELVEVPGGPMIAGGDAAAPGSWPARRVNVPTFLMGRHPVTWRAWDAWLATLTPDEAAARAPRAERAAADAPVVGISWDDAAAWCAWASARTGRRVRMPTEVQWEKAARGADGRAYPWGNHFDATWCNMAASRADGRPRIGAVGEFAMDESPYGVRDLAGNVFEWCGDTFGPQLAWRTVRGGSWASDAAACRAAHRQGYPPDAVHPFLGFRLVCSVEV